MNLHQELGDSLYQSYGDLLSASPALNARLQQTLDTLELKAQRILEEETPYLAHRQYLDEAQANLARQPEDRGCLSEEWQQFRSLLRQEGMPDNARFWEQQIATAPGRNRGITLIRRLLQMEWRKQLERLEASWQIQRLSGFRQDMLEQLKAWLKMITELSRHFAPLGLDPGRLVDFSAVQGGVTDIDQLKRWADYMADNPEVMALCRRIGKMRQPSYGERLEPVMVKRKLPRLMDNAPAPESISGIRVGRDLPLALPAELALIGEAAADTLFNLRYLEAQLACFDRRGWEQEYVTCEVWEQHAVRFQENNGPMILCVDTSLSMQGAPEQVAKAVSLYLALTARSGQRPCYLINFSTEVATLNLSGADALPALLGFLGQSFYGGTDVVPALEAALELMSQQAFRLADLVILSDFVMATLPQPQVEAMSAMRARGNRFYAVVIGEMPGNDRYQQLFDCQWHYDAETGAISEKLRDPQADARLSAEAAVRTQGLQGSA
ncbi:VWA domain-containing protein [Ferrimonas sediminicola]|uniref:VWA domain-containing protein n=1 Tax=Ferrimonas sediminicola TaxID=2569538 RepID=UPI00145CC5D5|nr:VWA domain-containing protein [Ferrimonas sediminicola]